MKPEDIFYKKTLTYNFQKQSLRFRTSQELFSSHDVDQGTQFLLRSIVEAGYPSFKSILDIGCGYGPLGLTLKKLYPEAAVHLTDRDALAVEYTKQNVELNGLSGVDARVNVYGSLGYDDLPNEIFDLIVCNIPGKAGEPVIKYLLTEAGNHLSAEGRAAIVIVSALEDMVKTVLSKTAGIDILLERSRPGHRVFHYRFNSQADKKDEGQSALDSGVYRRNDQLFHFRKMEYRMETAYGLPEFDSLDYRSELLMQALKDQSVSSEQKAAVYNPGQGHVAVLLQQSRHPGKLDLIDRDLLALRYTKLNLIRNGCPAENIAVFHQTGIAGPEINDYHLICGILREEEGVEAARELLKQAGERLDAGGILLLSAGSTAVTRLAAFLQKKPVLRIQAREKWRGRSLLALSK